MTDLVLFVVIFVVAGVAFLIGPLMLGWLLRPNRPSAEKATVYECGEPTIGSAWVQFDLRFYVVALLFVIFDVELAFFFPWAVVFGSANRAAEGDVAAAQTLQPTGPGVPALYSANPVMDPAAARELAWVAFADILVFFGVLLVGFAYLWRRGDLAWVRSTAAQGQSASVGVGMSEAPPREPAPVHPSPTH